MNEGQTILKDQIDKLPKKLQDYVLKGTWADKLQTILSNFNLEEYQRNSIENEVLLVLVGLEQDTDLKENIEKGSETIPDVAETISQKISDDILDQIEISETVETQSQNNIGTSFEQIILNQAKAMQPARQAGWVPPDRSMNNESRIMNQKEEKPTNLPTGDSGPKVIHNYINEPDPYREPLE